MMDDTSRVVSSSRVATIDIPLSFFFILRLFLIFIGTRHKQSGILAPQSVRFIVGVLSFLFIFFRRVHCQPGDSPETIGTGPPAGPLKLRLTCHTFLKTVIGRGYMHVYINVYIYMRVIWSGTFEYFYLYTLYGLENSRNKGRRKNTSKYK